MLTVAVTRVETPLLVVADKNIPFAREAFGPLGRVELVETGGVTPEIVRTADALVVRSETRVDARLLEGSRVRFVGTATIGTDHCDIGYFRSRGIAFASAPGSNAASVSEYLVAALLVLAERRNLTLAGMTLGVVGVGHVGSKVVRAAGVLGMLVLQCDPPLGRATGEERYRPLDELMGADIVTLHVPLTAEGPDPTLHLFNRERIARMKRGAVLINTARGAVVDQGALKDALSRGALSAAILDVWENEPAIDTDLLSQALLGTPHIAGYSLDGKVNAVRLVCEALYPFAGKDLREIPSFMLPPPASATVALESVPVKEAALRTAVQHCYDIAEDDRRLRALASVSAAERPGLYRRLRTAYPVRREFPAFTVSLAGASAALAPAFRSLRYRVRLPGEPGA